MAEFLPAQTASSDDLSHHSDAVNALYKASQLSESTKQLAATLKYQGSLNPDTLEDGIRESQGRIGAELFQMGARLLLLKEQCPHGEFLERLERLDINHRAAQKFMQVSAKFANAPLTAHLQKLGKTKVLELLALDDQEIEQLGEEGSVRGLQLDEIDRMSCSELRKKLREANNKAEAAERLTKAKNDTIDSLLTELDRKPLQLPSADDELAKLHGKVAELTKVLQAAIETDLRGRLIAVISHHDAHGGASDQVLLGHINQISNALAELRDQFALSTTVDGVPEWQRWDDEPLDPLHKNQLDLLKAQES
jgi:hypothetical protein